MVPGAAAKDAFEHAGALAGDGVGALALAVVSVRQMAATTFEARDERGRLFARAGGMSNMVAAAALTEDGGVPSNVDAAMGAKHANTVTAKEGREGAVAVKDDDRDGGEGEGLEAFRAQEPAGEEA